MIDTDLYFKKLKDKSVFLYDFCNSVIENLTDDQLLHLPEFRGFVLKEKYFTQEPIIKKLHDQFEVGMAGIFITEKNSGLDFHIDEPELRKVTINMLISSGVSHSVFKTKKDNSNAYEFKELVYEERTFYLYNVTREHAVMNFDKLRYMIQIKFKDNNLSYDNVFEWCQKNSLLEDQNKSK